MCIFFFKYGVIKSCATLKDSCEPLIWDNVCLANMEVYNFFIKLPPSFTWSKNFGGKIVKQQQQQQKAENVSQVLM